MPGSFCICLVCEMEGRPRFQVAATPYGCVQMKKHLLELHGAENAE